MGVETQQLIKKKNQDTSCILFFPFQMKSFCHEVPDVVLNIYVVVRIPSLSFLWCIWNEFLVASFFLVAKAAAGGLELLIINLPSRRGKEMDLTPWRGWYTGDIPISEQW